jgi:HlyD family secretion protein
MKTLIRLPRPRLARLTFVALALLLLAVISYAAWHFFADGGETLKFKQARVEIGPITAAVSATGTLNPVVSVQVGSQVSGQITEILVDFNSPVKAGQLIARLEPGHLSPSACARREADTDAARATLAVQQAEVAPAYRRIWLDAQRDFTRKQQVAGGKEIHLSRPIATRHKPRAMRPQRQLLQLAQAQIAEWRKPRCASARPCWRRRRWICRSH